MAISEGQLETWSHQGSTAQSGATYQTIKNVLESPHAPYSSRTFNVFLQGSYGNDTNIYADSDVDIVICLTSTFHADTSRLSEFDKAEYNRQRSPASYGLDDFKKEVTSWLAKNFGPKVKAGNKAIFIPGEKGRRDVDVLTCIEHRAYLTFPQFGTPSYHEGIRFVTASGAQIINYPKQHRKNCTTKHQSTGLKFKPNVRVLKNMRNRMIELGLLEEGVAPSYFIEGMLSNVPDHLIQSTFQKTFVSAFKWLNEQPVNSLMCANGIHMLIDDGRPVCWNEQEYLDYKKTAILFWNDWRSGPSITKI